MTGDEYRDIVFKLGFQSLNKAADWLGADDRLGQRWSKDGPPASVTKLLRLMLVLSDDYGLAASDMPHWVDREVSEPLDP